MEQNKEYMEEKVSEAINAAIDDTSLEDDEVEKYHDAALEAITGKVQAKTAAEHHGLDITKLNALIKIAERKLNGGNNSEQENAQKTDNGSLKGRKTEKNSKTNKSKETTKGKKAEEGGGGGHKKAVATKKDEEEKTVQAPPKKPDRRKRRKNEDVLIEEANNNVLKGRDLDSEALSLVLYQNQGEHKKATLNNKSKRKVAALEQEEEEEGGNGPSPPPVATTRSRRSLGSPPQLKALPWKQSESSTSTSRRSNPTSSNSLALVPFSQSGPKPSKGAIHVAPKTSNGQDKTKSAANAANRSLIKPNNDRWAEYEKVTADIVDEVLCTMQSRNDDDRTRKANMRAGIMAILFSHTPIIHAAKEHGVGVSTIRRYLKDVKERLEAFLGHDVVNEKILRQFQKYKKDVTLAHYREALIRAGVNVPPEVVEKVAGSRKRPSTTTKATPPVAPKSAAAAVNSLAPSMAAKRPRLSMVGVNPAAGVQKAVPSNNPPNGPPGPSSGKTPPNSQCSTAIMLKTQNPVLLTSRQHQRKALRGTTEQIRQQIQQFFEGKYSGDPAPLANVLTKYLLYSKRTNKLLTDFSLDVIKSSYMFLGRYFLVENIEFDDEEEEGTA